MSNVHRFTQAKEVNVPVISTHSLTNILAVVELTPEQRDAIYRMAKGLEFQVPLMTYNINPK